MIFPIFRVTRCLFYTIYADSKHSSTSAIFTEFQLDLKKTREMMYEQNVTSILVVVSCVT